MSQTSTDRKVAMSEQSPEERINNFSEVAQGYSSSEAVKEAERCLQCSNPVCKRGCPVEIQIPEFIELITDGDFSAALEKIKETNNLPAICGRVCPQKKQCEAECVLNNKEGAEPVAIGRLERAAADYGQDSFEEAPEEKKAKVAVVGAGPTGLTAAADLTKLGYEVTIFESFHEAGGVLTYGIPEFRLPNEVVKKEIENIKELGVEIKLNKVIGKTKDVDELLAAGFEAVFVGTGAGLPIFLGLEGENLNGVYSANEFLTRVNLMNAYQFPEYKTPVYVGDKVGVIGAGNVAMDAARTALRLGAEEVKIIYRRGQEQMPARAEEIDHAREEGVQFELLTNPTRILGSDGYVTGMECIQMELGEPDDSGRPRPISIADSEFIIDLDMVVMAIGQKPNPVLINETSNLEADEYGTLKADEETGATSKEGVFAGGDIVTGAATVIEAMAAGKRAARGIDRYIQEEK